MPGVLESLTIVSPAEGLSDWRCVSEGEYARRRNYSCVWLLRREEYRQTVKALLEKDPELMALAVEWVRLREQYERALERQPRSRK